MTLTRYQSSTKSLWFDLFRLVCYGLILSVFLGFLGRFTAIGDSLAVFRPELSVLCAMTGAIAFAFGKRLIPALSLAGLIFSVVSLLPYLRSAPPEQIDVTLRQHNVLFNNPNPSDLVMNARESGADVLMFQEVGPKMTRHLEPLLETHHHFQQCHYGDGGVAVFARDLGPLVGHGCAEKGKLAWIRLHTAHGAITFASVHLLWPWPMGQYWQSVELATEIEALPRPIVIAGDFNMVPWAATTRMLARAAGGEMPPGFEPTFELWRGWPAFRIDNLILPTGSRSEVRLTPKLGSDHFGLDARIELSVE